MIIALMFGVSFLMAEIIRNKLILPILTVVGSLLFMAYVIIPVTETIWYFITDVFYFIVNLF